MKGIIAGGAIALLLLLVGLVWALGSRAKARLAAKYPPPGEMVDVGGYQMHIHCLGTHIDGRPTVVIDAGNGEPSLGWAAIQREVARFTRVCTYDRAGLGWSERSPRPRTAPHVVAELHALLARAGVAPPYVLVGHSLGGALVRLYAHEHPDQVVGMVLVDPFHEELEQRVPEAMTRLNQKGRKMMIRFFRLAQLATATGLPALLPRLIPRQALATVPQEAHEAYTSLYARGTKHYEGVIREMSAIEDTYAAMRAAQITTLGAGRIPLVVLSAPDQYNAFGRYLSAEDVERTVAAIDGLHAELAALSSKGRHINVRESSHYIHIDRPEVVIDAIREVVEQT